jgi:hypothetical protein
VAGLVIVAGASACGGTANDDGTAAKSGGDDAVVHFLDETEHARTVHFESVRRHRDAKGALSLAGDLDFDHDRGRYLQDNPNGVPLESVVTPNAYYAPAAMFSAFPSVGDSLADYRWVRLSSAALREKSTLDTAFGVDPFAVIDQLRDAEVVSGPGRTTIDGENVTRYRLRLSVEAAARQAGIDAADVTETDRTMDVWVDSHDRLRRARLSSADWTTTVDLTSYGEPVEVVEPAGDDVYDAGALFPDHDADYDHLGAWHELAKGTFDDGMTWAVWNASAGDDWGCWTLETDPQVPTSSSLSSLSSSASDIDVLPAHNGVEAACDQVPSESLISGGMLPLSESGYYSEVEHAPLPRVFAGVAMTKVARAVVSIRGGAKEAATVARDNVVAWNGPANTKLDRVEVTLEDGRAIVCEPIRYPPGLEDENFRPPDDQLACHLARR